MSGNKKVADGLGLYVKKETLKHLCAVAVMRIQNPNGPHEGHMRVISKLFEYGEKVLIFLAEDRSFPSNKNPFSFSMRKKMLDSAIAEQKLEHDNYEIIPFRNRRRNNVWVNELEKAISSSLRKLDLQASDVVMVHGRDSFADCYTPTGKFTTFDVGEIKGVSATRSRDSVSGISLSMLSATEAIVLHQKAQPSYLFTQVRVIIRSRDGRIAIIKYNSPDEEKHRFIGGYVSTKKDITLEDSVIRKTRIKTNIALAVNSLKYLGSVTIDDWRHAESGYKSMVIVYETFVDPFDKSFSANKSAQISELLFVERNELLEYIDEEEQVIITLIK